MSDTPPLQLKNPFVGLRAFEENEHFLFFGRDKPIEDLSNRLINNRFLAVIGSSGSGKSSLVKSGLLPNIFSGFFTPGRNWRVALMRPGEDPIGYLTNELAAKGTLYNYKEQNDIHYASIIEASLRRSENGLVQVYKEAFGLLHFEDSEIQKKKTDNLLIVVDQFEELFRFRKYEKDKNLGISDAQHFIKLLLTAAQQSECPIYVLLTMRSDFLGDCSEFNGLPEAINNGQYLVPRMTREEIRQCIENPLAVGNTRIAPRLVSRLLNEINNDTDQLPILQHAMMRLWDAWYERMLGYWEVAKLAKKKSLEEWNQWTAEKWNEDVKTMNYPPEELEIKKKKREKKMLEVWQQASINDDLSFNAWYYRNPVDTEIDFDDYDKIGGLGKALSNHADIAYSELKTKEDQKICELMFKALTDKTADARGTRRPRPVADLAQLCSTTTEKIISTVEIFRQPGRTFLMPPPEKGNLTPETIIDISHESLMRVWELLVQWTNEEAKDSDTFKRLADDANRYKNGVGTLWTHPVLEIGLDWRKKFNNNDELIKIWAKSYNADVVQALAFLQESNEAAIALKAEKEKLIKEKKDREEAEAKKIKEDEEKERLRKQKNNRIAIAVLFLFLLGAIASLVGVNNEREKTLEQKNKADSLYQVAHTSDSLSQIAEAKAKVERDSAEAAKNRAHVSDSLSKIAAAAAHKSDSLAQIDKKNAIKAKIEALAQKDTAINLSRKSAVGEYQKLIREGPEDDKVIIRDNFDYKVVAYCYHLDFLKDSLKIVNAGKKNNELYEKLYFPLKALKKTDLAITKTGDKVTHDQSNNLSIIDKSDNLEITAAKNNCIIVRSLTSKQKTDTIYMGKEVTAITYLADENIIFFGMINGEIGFIKYTKDNKNQPVFNRRNDLRSKITALQFFNDQKINYLLATSYLGQAVMFEFDNSTAISSQFKPNTKIPVIELPEYYGEIENAHYDAAKRKIVLKTSKATYDWNPFAYDLLKSLEAQLNTDKLRGIKKSTLLYK